MAKIRLYTIIFAVLMVVSTIQFALEYIFIAEEIIELNYWIVFSIIMVLSSMKAVVVAGWYMHMIEEPRSITYLALAGLILVLALTAGAGYSIL